MTDRPTLGDVCEAIVDCEHKTAPADPAGPAWSVGTPALIEGRIDFSQARRISAATYVAWTRRMIPREGDLILAREAPVGPVAMVPAHSQVALGQRTVLLRPDVRQANARYLHAILTSPPIQHLMLSKAEGSTVAHLNVAEVRDLTLPPLPEVADQRAIAEILDALDDKIASNSRVTASISACLQVLGQALRALPAAPLSALARASRETVDPQAIGSARVEHFSIPAFDAGLMPDLTPASSIMSGKFAVRGPRILVSRLNPRSPRVWYAIPSTNIAVASTEFLVLNDPEAKSLAGVWLAVTAESFTAEMQQRATGTSGSHQRVRPADALAINVPDTRRAKPAQLEEADALLSAMHQRHVESQAIRALRDTVLPELLSGRIRISEVPNLLEAVL